MKPITRKQLEVYDALAKYIDKRHYSPSIEELTMYTSRRSKSTTYVLLKHLRDKGYVTWENGQPRTLKIRKNVSLTERKRLERKAEYVF